MIEKCPEITGDEVQIKICRLMFRVHGTQVEVGLRSGLSVA